MSSTAGTKKLLVLFDSSLGHVTAYIRGLYYKDLFKKQGWDATFINTYPKEPNRDLRKYYRPEGTVIEKAKAMDLIYLLKVADLTLIQKLKNISKAKIIFDLTDALWQPYHRAHGFRDLEKILAAVDVLFSENEFICAYGRKYNHNIFSIPVCLQIEKYDRYRHNPLVRLRNRKKIIIGWIGSGGTVTALQKIHPQLQKLCQEFPQVEFRFLGAGADQLKEILPGIRFSALQHYDEMRMIRESLRMDIGIFPPPGDFEDYQIRGALKGMIYMAAGIPAVFLNAGDCTNFIRDGVNGMLTNTTEEWYTKLKQLIEDTSLRKSIGAKGLETVRAEHSLQHVFEKLTEALDAVLAMPKDRQP
jgi:glycosyltransferase involved in cell wall biosynthesis